ncbi:MAG: MBOAT family O-acyltransferase [Fimbriiglobus sp.]
MIFASKAFFLFLPLILLLYHGSRRRTTKYRWLLLASWLVYGFVPPHYWPVIFLLTLIDYVAALRIEATEDELRRRRWLIASIVSNLGLLFAFKYTPFVWENTITVAEWCGWSMSPKVLQIVLPLGISFHTFQGISYTVDVYRRQIQAVKSFTDYALFVSFFPQLAAGPIVRAIEFLPQMVTPPTVTAKCVEDAIWLFAVGLFKKLVIADQLDLLFVGPVFEHPELYDASTHRWAILAWAVQIYCDFSGYTDMALGCAKAFGFELPPNFRLPYLATSITDFWRRWHLSLSTWLRDYLYFPMGGSRGSALRTNFNLMTLFVLCGLWHGATWNWLAYGALNGVLMCLHRSYDRRLATMSFRKLWAWKVFAWVITMYQFLIGLILIRMNTWADGWLFTKSLSGQDYQPASTTVPFNQVIAILIVLGLTGHIIGLIRDMGVPLPTIPTWLKMAFAALLLVAVVVFSPGVAKTFIYIQF